MIGKPNIFYNNTWTYMTLLRKAVQILMNNTFHCVLSVTPLSPEQLINLANITISGKCLLKSQ